MPLFDWLVIPPHPVYTAGYGGVITFTFGVGLPLVILLILELSRGRSIGRLLLGVIVAIGFLFQITTPLSSNPHVMLVLDALCITVLILVLLPSIIKKQPEFSLFIRSLASMSVGVLLSLAILVWLMWDVSPTVRNGLYHAYNLAWWVITGLLLLVVVAFLHILYRLIRPRPLKI